MDKNKDPNRLVSVGRTGLLISRRTWIIFLFVFFISFIIIFILGGLFYHS